MSRQAQQQGRITGRSRCPRCKKNGRDRSGDNLITYSDGHSKCYSCGYYGHPPNSLTNMAKKLYKHKTTGDSPYLDGLNMSERLPPKALQWLNKYGITEQERHVHRIAYDYEKDCLVLPVYDGERLVCTNSRYFGDNPDHPKYVTRGYKTGHYKLVPQPLSKWPRCLVLTEDYISALRVGRVCSAVPLLGASVPIDFILRCVGTWCPILVWLDPDKRTESIRIANRISQFTDSRAVITDKDPKDFTDDEISGYLQSATREQCLLPPDEDSVQGSS